MPDLNSVPASPHALAAPRRQSSHQMPPPATSQSPSLNILPSNQDVVSHGQSSSHGHTHSRHHSLSHAASSVPSPQLAASQPLQPQVGSSIEPGVGPGPGPLRHPRPLTAAELHSQLEKEQEAVVNRLTRELSLLRAAQNASVVSNASSTSAPTSTHDPIADTSLLSGSGFSIPTTRRHHRNSSSASQNFATSQLASSYEARHHIPSRPSQPVPLSRQDSAASRRSQTNSPGPQVSSLDPSSYFHQQRIPPAASAPMSSVAATPGSGSMADQMSPALMAATSRYEETAFYRSELETAKKENEALKRRIRDLERMVQNRRASETSRTRSESVSTTASASVATAGGAGIAGPRDVAASRPERGRGMTSQSVASASSVAVGVPEDEVKVGESAASSGVGNNQP
ncbi:hypothetical protein JDV02_008596 [Purpureocillium takamizusanense]|uniref:Uncharacterized protein n=1 Tax=Purpureocillium takamizusanense TaxID=2060973 RepID=A0A9Q8QN68_9HYPO|nr:uncharacterized protein JDV02_008596 [Purpureocillium takamizusanense]UNI22733.1 hypothetical protein JDV02_008596 [Purpureocillium takamizusanense]